MKAKILIFLLGLLIGLAAAVLFPRVRERLTPDVLRQAPTEGVVEEKRREPDRLLLTLVTADGAVLATFTQRVSEIDLLVAPGDTVSLALDGYRPFVEDPGIDRVVKAPRHEAEVQPAPAIESPPEPPADASAEPRAEGPSEPLAEDPGEPQSDDPIEPRLESPVDPQPEPGG